jgi:hypothetical protein
LLRLSYSFHHLLITFIIPILVVILGFKHSTEMSADLSLIYSIIFMVFFPLNANFRHYIVNSNEKKFLNHLIWFRLLSYIPLFLISLTICSLFLDIELSKSVIIIFIGTFYWLNEVFVSLQEKRNKVLLTCFISLVYVIMFFFIIYFDSNIFYSLNLLAIITFLSLFIISLFIFKELDLRISFKKFKINIFKKIVPQIGGTFVIGLSSFLFKIIILAIVSKSVAGTIFIAFTLSGLFLTVFTYGLGPSVIQVKLPKKTLLIYFILVTFLNIFIGISILSIEYWNLIEVNFVNNQTIFFYCLGFALLGVPISILSQYYKLSVIYQNLKMKIYIYDAIPNLSILFFTFLSLISCEPYWIGLTYLYTGTIGFFIYKGLLNKQASKNLLI